MRNVPIAAVRERPILFNGPMVRAVLDGHKTQTRRVVKPQPKDVPELGGFGRLWFDGQDELRCPYGVREDRLWVRETWCPRSNGALLLEKVQRPYYSADSEHGKPAVWRWRPSIHMPRWASRILLEVTGVRIERLHELSEADACAEGMGSPITRDCKVPKFAALWDELNGAGAWEANPWVWVIEFKRVEASHG